MAKSIETGQETLKKRYQESSLDKGFQGLIIWAKKCFLIFNPENVSL